MIFELDGKRACLKDNILSVALNINKSTVDIQGETYKIVSKTPSEFNKGVFNYLVEKALT